MAGFIYNGQSSDDILESSPLLMASFDPEDAVIGHERDNVIGEPTISRPIANEYGTQYQALEINYGLIKRDLTPFTNEEQRIVERWLTSPKLSQKLQFIDCKSKELQGVYCGKFLSTEWYPANGGWAGVQFLFQNNSMYPTMHHSSFYQIRGMSVIEIDCPSDELEEYVYPKLTIMEPSETAEVSIQNVTDNNNTMKINARHELSMVFDCQNCIPSDGTSSGIFTYDDLGWEDVGNIYWLRLLPGKNTLRVTGNADITIEFDYPYKKVGVWV